MPTMKIILAIIRIVKTERNRVTPPAAIPGVEQWIRSSRCIGLNIKFMHSSSNVCWALALYIFLHFLHFSIWGLPRNRLMQRPGLVVSAHLCISTIWFGSVEKIFFKHPLNIICLRCSFQQEFVYLYIFM